MIRFLVLVDLRVSLFILRIIENINSLAFITIKDKKYYKQVYTEIFLNGCEPKYFLEMKMET